MAQERGNKELMANHERYFLNAETMQESNLIQILQNKEKVELPPALLIQGTADKGVPQGMVEKVHELYGAAGGNVELALFPDMPHGLAGWSDTEAARMIERVKSFIAKQVAAS
jgi:dipeptidyl aminopeptidase/acylaminoacyl peptidase